MEDIFVPIAFFAAVVAIVYLSIQANLRRAKMEHEERMLAIEKGVALPPLRPPEKMRNPYKWPVILIAIGFAMLVAMLMQTDDDWVWGLLPLLIGLGMLISHRHLMKERERTREAENFVPFPMQSTEKQPSAE